MAQLIPDFQTFVDLKNGTTVGITIVTLTSASDTVQVPALAQVATVNVSSSALRRPGDDTGVTVTDDATAATNGNVITITGGTAGNKVLLSHVHGPAGINFGLENTPS